ncbi:MAG TPA: xanthine dehydrogenase family protein molybdopterin-binding subunit, partial [Thermoanaerobaculia bacterium]|nr:xanthine dehydrogenase family protein molybdopterin-binding subunit [Thermoanaerobaculia bacterium]
GRLRGIRRDPGFDFSGLTVVTAEDVPVNVVMLIEEDQPVLVPIGGEVRHVYEPLALVAGDDPRRVALALRHLHPEIDPLPPLFSMEESLAKKEILHGKDNVFKRFRIEKGDAKKALASCEVVVTGSYSVHHQEQLYIEPQGVIAWWDEKGAHVLGSLQCPYYVHKGVKKTFSLHEDEIDVTQAVTGGGFGGKEEYPTVISLHALLLAKKSGRPVKMIYDRKEDIEATTKRHPATMSITSGCDRDGTLRALHVSILMDGGAYVTLTPVVLSRGTIHAAGAYRWDDVLVESVAVATSTPPNGAFRGFGAPQTIWAIERHLDKVAKKLGIDPLELKTKNALRVGDTTATSQRLAESVGIQKCIEAAVSASGYFEKRAAFTAARAIPDEDLPTRKVRGIGASVFMHGAGFTGSGERRMKGRAAVDLARGAGGELRLLIRTASTDIGQGTETVFRQIAAEGFGVPLERVDFATPSTAVVPDSGPTVASRTVMVVGSIVERAAKELKERVDTERTARGGSRDEAGLRLVASGNATSEKVYDSPPGLQWDDDTYKGDAYPCYGWGCDIAEVEVDLDTFETTVVGFWAAQDVGKAIHPLMCAGQIEGGTLQAIGWALNERITWNEGKITNARMTNYIVPTSLDAPPFTTLLVEEPFSQGPGGGAKGLGELPMDGGAPAVAAAIENATGIARDDLPLLPEDLFETSEKP